MNWIIENIGTICIGSAVFALIALIIYRLIVEKKNKKSCNGCPFECACHELQCESKDE